LNTEALRQIIGRIPRPDGGLAADLGTGEGRVVALLRDVGWDVVGCELRPEAAELARARGARIDLADMLAWAPPESVQMATCVEVIEHLPADAQLPLLRRIREWLPADGHLVFSTPQRNSVVSVLERGWAKIRGRQYDWWDPTHTSILSRREILDLVERSGFEVVEVLGVHVVSDLVAQVVKPAARLANTVHRGRIGWLGFDLVLLLRPRPS
jgi:2-polyprenyl-3-methyl-5-hydroxy-6-metoxy-1,4-benzoquinol methylase